MAPTARRRRRWVRWLPVAIGAYLLVAYLALPAFWKRDDRAPPVANAMPTLTQGADGLPGDPVNLEIVGDATRLHDAMLAAGWVVADPLDAEDDARIVVDTLDHHAYPDAPVSRLFLYGRAEDVAFEMPIGDDPARRHHVRFWRVPSEPVRWLGAASLDQSVGLARTTGQVTHHIAPDVDAERDHVLATLRSAGRLQRLRYIDGFQHTPAGSNAGGDPWRSDGRLGVGVLRD